MQYYLAVWSLLFGLVIGSFLNVVIYRLPRRESLTHPGSHCPACGAAIRWYDNVPVLSWLVLRGRCRSCHTRIAIRYPLVESLTGAAFLGAFLGIGLSPAVLLAWALAAVLVVLLFIDHDLAIVPNRVLLPAVACGLGAAAALDPGHWWYYPAGSAGSGLVALTAASLVPGVARFSVAKIALLLGAVFGLWAVPAVPVALALAAVAGNTPVFREKGRLRARARFSLHKHQDTREDVQVVDRHQTNANIEVMTWL